jgi:hypothetical protein
MHETGTSGSFSDLAKFTTQDGLSEAKCITGSAVPSRPRWFASLNPSWGSSQNQAMYEGGAQAEGRRPRQAATSAAFALSTIA